MSRSFLVLGVIVTCFALILWSGFQNRYVPTAIPVPARPVETSATPAAQDSHSTPSPLLGKPAPVFTLRDLAGHSVRLADYRGKAVLINFWATWCTPCVVEMPWFIALQQKYGPQGFVVLGVDKDFPEDVPTVPAFARKMALNYPVLYGDDKTATAYGCCDYLPMSYYVDRSGTVQVATVGLGDRDTVEADVRRLLKSSTVQPETQITLTKPAPPSPP